eukprot:NODE_220_length_1626_cov_261.819277_g154_i0.p2 GENE.NODE_220_length_1626_cov_261.819277_g154_i0~~NODE_220_length_1626_cov_261.819277_g154_i0.p2  ORF type:complete len:316 (+),score=92.97 NODE_220_length_1626_cov_261.819277_g154_i0:85-1032(+)
MATRNRTPDFIKIRTAVKGSHSERSTASDNGLLQAEEAPFNQEMALRPATDLGGSPAWVETIEIVKEIDSAVKSRMGRLRHLHAAHLKPQFGKDEEREEREIDLVTEEIKGLFKRGEAAVRELVAKEGDLRHKTPDEQKLLQNVQISLVTQINELSKAFREEQRKYLTEVKKQKDRAKKLVSFGTLTPEEEEQEERERTIQRYVDKGFTPEQIDALAINEQMISERDMELQNIYTSIVDLHEIFKDLNALVIDQGTLVDRIDYNIEETKSQILAANKELMKAGEYQKKSRFMLIVLLLLVLIVAMVFALILKIIF